MGLKVVKPFRGGNNFNWSEFKDEVEGSPSQKAFADVWGFKDPDRGPAQWGWDYFHGNWGRWMRSPKKWQRNAGYNRHQDFYKAVWDLWDTDEFRHLWPGAGSGDDTPPPDDDIDPSPSPSPIDGSVFNPNPFPGNEGKLGYSGISPLSANLQSPSSMIGEGEPFFGAPGQDETTAQDPNPFKTQTKQQDIWR